MPPPRRSSRLAAAAAVAAAAVAAAAAAPAAESRSKRGGRSLSVRRGAAFKREGRAAADAADGDDLPLGDEALLAVFSALSGATADLVRCAATCRRWCRLVSGDAAFICRGAAPRSDPIIRGLALGFFHSRAAAGGGPPRFAPLPPAAAAAAASRHLPSLAALAGGASRVVASRSGRLVLDLRRRATARTTHAVRLGVCNPVAGGGGVDALPPLRGRDSPAGPYACTVLTAADELHPDDDGGGDRIASPYSAYRVLLLYNRRGFTALRCYSSEAGAWGPEAEVTGARVGRSQLAGPLHAAVVHRGVVFWPRLAVALRLDALRRPAAVAAPKNGRPRHAVAGMSPSPRRRHPKANLERLVGVMPDGRMLRVEADSETIRAYCGGDTDAGEWWLGGAPRWKWTMKLALMRLHTVRLRWLCERSGVVIFTAGDYRSGAGDHAYTVDVETMQVARVAAGGEPAIGEEVCGYEMDRVTLLAALRR
ncbi:hypothetical protein ACP4OV_029408 [Aristida adscensionis]